MSLDNEENCIKITKEWPKVSCLSLNLKKVKPKIEPINYKKKLNLQLLNIRVNLITTLAEVF